VRATGRAFDLLGTPAAVVELFPRRAPVPRTLPDVLDRMFSCGSEPARPGRRVLRPDQPHLVARIDAAVPPDSDIRDDPTYRQIWAHRRIEHLSVVTSSLPSDQSATADFLAGVLRNADLGRYDDAVAQGIGNPRALGLRFSTTAAWEDAAPRW
jgi:hypothetical protein